MPRPLKVLDTAHPFGVKINEVMAEKGYPGDYRRLAQEFGVTTPSAREWVLYGRFSKDRFEALAAWSGRPLEWWFSTQAAPPAAPPPAMAPALKAAAAEGVYKIGKPPPPWPFPRIDPADFALLDVHDRAEIEGFVKGLIAATKRKRRAA